MCQIIPYHRNLIIRIIFQCINQTINILPHHAQIKIIVPRNEATMPYGAKQCATYHPIPSNSQTLANAGEVHQHHRKHTLQHTRAAIHFRHGQKETSPCLQIAFVIMTVQCPKSNIVLAFLSNLGTSNLFQQPPVILLQTYRTPSFLSKSRQLTTQIRYPNV